MGSDDTIEDAHARRILDSRISPQMDDKRERYRGRIGRVHAIERLLYSKPKGLCQARSFGPPFFMAAVAVFGCLAHSGLCS